MVAGSAPGEESASGKLCSLLSFHTIKEARKSKIIKITQIHIRTSQSAGAGAEGHAGCGKDLEQDEREREKSNISSFNTRSEKLVAAKAAAAPSR